jgi:hypothetical protein
VVQFERLPEQRRRVRVLLGVNRRRAHREGTDGRRRRRPPRGQTVAAASRKRSSALPSVSSAPSPPSVPSRWSSGEEPPTSRCSRRRAPAAAGRERHPEHGSEGERSREWRNGAAARSGPTIAGSHLPSPRSPADPSPRESARGGWTTG